MIIIDSLRLKMICLWQIIFYVLGELTCVKVTNNLT